MLQFLLITYIVIGFLIYTFCLITLIVHNKHSVEWHILLLKVFLFWPIPLYYWFNPDDEISDDVPGDVEWWID